MTTTQCWWGAVMKRSIKKCSILRWGGRFIPASSAVGDKRIGWRWRKGVSFDSSWRGGLFQHLCWGHPGPNDTKRDIEKPMVTSTETSRPGRHATQKEQPRSTHEVGTWQASGDTREVAEVRRNTEQVPSTRGELQSSPRAGPKGTCTTIG